MGDADEGKVCLVYNINDWFTTFVQMFLAAVALAALWIKRMNEVPRRKLLTWWYDVSKQALGACYGHILNMLLAFIIAGNVRGSAQLDDQCAWYAINFLIDVTLGLMLAVAGVHILDYYANKYDIEDLKNSGVYTGPTATRHWFSQLLAWLFILTIVKVLMLFFLWFASEPLAAAAGFLFKPLQQNIRFELIFVMIILPGIVNVLYFWVTDHFLKAKKEHTAAHESPDGQESRTEALLHHQADAAADANTSNNKIV